MLDDPAFKNARPIDRLLAVMARLRDTDGGCPWDLAQNFKTIAPYTIEEAYEVADAIEREDMPGLKDELGDLLLAEHRELLRRARESAAVSTPTVRAVTTKKATTNQIT